jgi:hypothetical protein
MIFSTQSSSSLHISVSGRHGHTRIKVISSPVKLRMNVINIDGVVDGILTSPKSRKTHTKQPQSSVCD